MSRDYYKLLKVEQSATAEQIQSAYRAMAFQFHPDRNHTPGGAMIMSMINEAYEVLGEPRKRSAYDRKRPQASDKVGETILRAARDHVLRKNWQVVHDRPEELVLAKGMRRTLVATLHRVDSAILRRYRERAAGFVALLTLHVGPLAAPPPDAVVIDLKRSRVIGSFPDPEYRELFEVFLGPRKGY